MKLLALETSTENCSVAVLNNDNVFFDSQIARQKHGEMILPMIDDVLSKSSMSKDDLDGIVLSVGPGSFTGVRIAASTAQGLALGLNLKVALVSSLEALALEAIQQNHNAKYVISSIDARMGEVYICAYKVSDNNLQQLFEPQVLKPIDALNLAQEHIKDFNNTVGAGSGIDILYTVGLDNTVEKLADFPKAQFILEKGKSLFENDDVVAAQDALPLYVRNEVTWKKVNEQ